MALILLAAIAVDVADVTCDCLSLAPFSSALSLPHGGTADACGDRCVPDCYCCSTSLAAVPVLLVAELSPVSEAPAPPACLPSSGISPVLDHVPLATR